MSDKLAKLSKDWFFVALLGVVLVVQCVGMSRRSDYVSKDDFEQAMGAVRSAVSATPASRPAASSSPSSPLSGGDTVTSVPPSKDVRELPIGVTFFRAGDVWCMMFSNVVFKEGDLSPFDSGRLEVIRPCYVASSVCEYGLRKGDKYGS